MRGRSPGSRNLKPLEGSMAIYKNNNRSDVCQYCNKTDSRTSLLAVAVGRQCDGPPAGMHPACYRKFLATWPQAS